jgi:hypothetical protein
MGLIGGRWEWTGTELIDHQGIKEGLAIGKPGPLYGKPPKQVTIYFIGPANGPIKIGYASRLSFRLRDLELANPYPLHVWASVEGPLKLEREYHACFAAHRLHGEWFARCLEIEAEIARLNEIREVAA